MEHRTTVAGATISWAVVPERERRRATGRELLRRVLAPSADLVQVCPACGGDHGPVRVRIGGEPGPLVSVSYAGPLAVVGMAPHGAAAFGIDVELEDEPTRAAVHEATGSAEVVAWTRREAVAKALGTGLREEGGRILTHPGLPDRWIAPSHGLHGFDAVIAHDGGRAALSVALR